MSALAFDRVCAVQGLPVPVAEYRFAPPRKWAWDWSWPEHLLALEKNGGVWIRGKHSRGKGQINDMEKWTEAAARGWRILHCVPDDLESDRVLTAIGRALEARRT